MKTRLLHGLAVLRARVPVAVHRAERALHLPYFGGVALHYGPLTVVGGTATLLFLVGVAGLFLGEDA